MPGLRAGLAGARDYGRSCRHDIISTSVLGWGLVMALYVYIILSLVMLYGAVHLLVVTFTKLKNSLFKMLFAVLGIGLIVGAVVVFLAGIYGASS